MYHEEIKNYIKEWITKNWSLYYNINKIDVTIEKISIKEAKVDCIAQVSINKVLKAKSVGELPYIKGILKKINIADYERKLANELKVEKVFNANKSSLNNNEIRKMVKLLDDKYLELEEYIGKAYDSYIILKFEAGLVENIIEDKTIKLYVEQMNGFISANELIPKVPQEYEDMGSKEIVSALNVVKTEVEISQNLYVGYDRLKARDYAITWTSNASSYCPHGIALQNTSKWNNTKWPYQSSLCHNDCADFVSQSLNAGGIPIDPGKWERFNDGNNNWAWTYVPGLKNYMLNQKSYWKLSTWENASAGGVIVIPNSHVMMIVKNDTIERLYSAHTNDRLNYPYAKNTSWEYYVLW